MRSSLPWLLGAFAGTAPQPVAVGPDPQPERPLEWVDGARHQAGNTLAGTWVEHTFRLANRSDEPIRIRAWKDPGDGLVVRATLGTGPDARRFVPPAALAPGDELALTLGLDTLGLLGPLSYTVAVDADRPPAPRRAQLMVRVLPLFRFDPIACDFGQLRPDGRPVRELVLTTPFEEPFRPRLDERTVPAALSVTTEPRDPLPDGRARSWRVRVAVAERPTAETFPAAIGFDAELGQRTAFRDAEGRPRTLHAFQLAVGARFKDWVVAIPPRIELSSRQRPTERDLRLRPAERDGFELRLGADDFRFETLSGEIDWTRDASVEIQRIGTDDGQVRVLVRVRPRTPLERDAEGVLIVRIGHPDLEELRVPVVVRP